MAVTAATNNNIVYVHSSPPKAISGTGAAIRNWVKNGDLDKLESLVLDGQGARLLGLIESTNDPKVKNFLKQIPGYMAKVDLIHDAVIRGSLRETQGLLDKRKLATARDAVGRGLGHKAVLYNHKSLLEWLSRKYPEVIHLRDNEGRNCLHYTAAAKEPMELYSMLVNLGANPDAIDIHGKKAGHYINHPQELDIEGPSSNNRRVLSRNNTTKRAVNSRRISPGPSNSNANGFGSGQSGRIFASPPPYNSSTTTPPPQTTMTPPLSTPPPTRAQIRIWIHEQNLSKLEKIVWSGNGDKLLLETTNNSRVRRFLDNVPHLLSAIKQIHTASIHNDIQNLKHLKSKINVREVFSAKDNYGLSALHKAVGLGNREAMEFLAYEFPETLEESDGWGRSVSAYVKDSGSGQFLQTLGVKPEERGDIDGRYLRNVPDAPRVSGELSGWDRGGSPSIGSGGELKRKISSGSFDDDGIVSNSRVSGKVGRWVEEHTIDDFEPEEFEEEAKNEPEAIEGSPQVEESEVIVNDQEGKYDIREDFELFEDGAPSPEMEEQMEELPQEPEVVGVVEMDTGEDEDTAASAVIENGIEDHEEDEVNEQSAHSISPSKKSAHAKSELAESAHGTSTAHSTSAHEKSAKAKTPHPVEDEGEEHLTEIAQPHLQDEDEEEEELAKLASESPLELDRASMPMVPQDIEQDQMTDMMEVSDDVVEDLIENGDMEQLVNLVLNGHGSKLLNKQTGNPEVQEFLTNVPAYMAKIASIHGAAGNGNMRDLQSLLDRKRLAQARDEYGRVPLHLAVLGGHSAVVRYLCSNNTASINNVDVKGRSALHYASTLGDQGTLYKVLIQAGADPNIKDIEGNTPGVYLRRKDLLSHSDLLRPSRNSAERGPSVPASTAKVDTWERPDSSQHRAASANQLSQSPQDDIEVQQSQLQLLTAFFNQLSSEPSIWSRTWTRLTSKKGTTDIAKAYVKKYLTNDIFEEIKTRSTPRYNTTLLDCIKFYPQFFLIAPDPHAYATFDKVFLPAIKDHNGLTQVDLVHKNVVMGGAATLTPTIIPQIDLPSKFVSQVRIRLSRNIRPFPFVSILNRENLAEIRNYLLREIKSRLYEDFEEIDLETLEKEEREELVDKRGVVLPDATKISRFWPKSRTVLLTKDKHIWINGQDHLDLIVLSQYGKLGPMLENLKKLYDNLTSSLDFHFNSQMGFLTVDPFRCGTGMKITLRLRLPHLMTSRATLSTKCDELNLFIKWKTRLDREQTEIQPDDYIELENIKTFGYDENEIAVGVAEAVNTLIKEEERLGREFDLKATKKKELGGDPKK